MTTTQILTMPEYKKMVGRPSEKNVHQQIVDYLKAQYPEVIFRTDFAAGIKMTIGQAMKHKRLQHSRAFPDLTIYHPGIAGKVLFLEIKRSRDEVLRKDGTFKKDEHIQEQAAMMDRLRGLGYSAQWALGFDNAKEIIDQWLK